MTNFTRIDFSLIILLFRLKICCIDEFDMEILLIVKNMHWVFLSSFLKYRKSSYPLFTLLSTLGIEPCASCMLGNHCATILRPYSTFLFTYGFMELLLHPQKLLLCLFYNLEFHDHLCFIYSTFFFSVFPKTTLIWTAIAKTTIQIITE